MSLEREQIGACTLYCGDARDVLPSLEPAACLVTDPPWASTGHSLRRASGDRRAASHKNYTLKKGTIGTWDAATIALCEQCCTGDTFFITGFKELGSMLATVRHYRGTFVWHKPNAPLSMIYPAKLDIAFIVWTAATSALYGYQHWPSMIFHAPVPLAGVATSERLLDDKRSAVHPAQGPVALYAQLLAPLPPTCCLDPFMGTGTTGIACMQQGRPFIGIEIDRQYFDLACRRIEDAYRQLTLFPTPERRRAPRQEGLL